MKITVEGRDGPRTMTVEKAVEIAEAEIYEHAYGAAVTYSRALFSLLLCLVAEKEANLKIENITRR